MSELFRVLIVDDDQVDRMAVLRALRSAGVELESEEAQSVGEALTALERAEFDCVFLDYQLPGGDGLRVLREARERGITTPVVMLTGQSDDRVAVSLMKAGASDYLNKDMVTAERLEQTLRHVVRVHRAELAADLAEERLRASEQRFRSLVEATSEAVWTTSPSGDLGESPTWGRLTGQTSEQMAGTGGSTRSIPRTVNRPLRRGVRRCGTALRTRWSIACGEPTASTSSWLPAEFLSGMGPATSSSGWARTPTSRGASRRSWIARPPWLPGTGSTRR
jgi:CheY-like chemotaxis protein